MNRLAATALFVTFLVGGASHASEPADSKMTAAQFAVRMMTDRYRTYAELCGAALPNRRSDFVEAADIFEKAAQTIAESILRSEVFAPLSTTAAPKDADRGLADQRRSLLEDWKLGEKANRCDPLMAALRNPDPEVLRPALMQYMAATQTLLVQQKKQESK
jgi:hypothetical protein